MIVTPGSCGGALAFKRAAGFAVDDDTVTLAETHTLHYAVRLLKPAHVRVFLKPKGSNFLAGLPGRHTAAILELIEDVYPTMEAADSVMQTTLQNANPVIHPAVSLCNAARIEGKGDFLFYEEGVSDSVGRLIEAVDKERMALGRKIGELTPTIDAIIQMASIVMNRDYCAERPRTPEALGIGDMSAEQLRNL